MDDRRSCLFSLDGAYQGLKIARPTQITNCFSAGQPFSSVKNC